MRHALAFLAKAGKIGKKGRRVSRISSIKIADDVALQEWGTWQLARDSIDVDREIGQGAHGYCNKGIMHGRGPCQLTAWNGPQALKIAR